MVFAGLAPLNDMPHSRSHHHSPRSGDVRSRRQTARTPPPQTFARLAAAAAAFTSPLDLERWTSSLLGRVWERRRGLICDRDVDQMLRLGGPLIEGFAVAGGVGGKTVLAAVAALERGPLGLLAAGLAAGIDDPLPPWSDAVGTARATRALSLTCLGGTHALVLGTDRTGPDAHMLAVFIDGEQGAIAKHLGVIRELEDDDPLLSDAAGTGGHGAFRPTPLLPACRRVRRAIGQTDDDPVAPIGPEFVHHRALVLSRVLNTLERP